MNTINTNISVSVVPWMVQKPHNVWRGNTCRALIFSRCHLKQGCVGGVNYCMNSHWITGSDVSKDMQNMFNDGRLLFSVCILIAVVLKSKCVG